MSQYLTKEEIKQWRSSLEKITLEEYAKKLGKVLEEEKQTSDIIDIVMKNEKRLYTSKENNKGREQVLRVARKALDSNDIVSSKQDSVLAAIKAKITCKKPLTQREETVLSYFAKNKGQIVYARDLAAILDLPCDYVYKYIKNLRTKISEDILQNAVKGGYVLNIQD